MNGFTISIDLAGFKINRLVADRTIYLFMPAGTERQTTRRFSSQGFDGRRYMGWNKYKRNV
jgi:hypothetical protein